MACPFFLTCHWLDLRFEPELSFFPYLDRKEKECKQHQKIILCKFKCLRSAMFFCLSFMHLIHKIYQENLFLVHCITFLIFCTIILVKISGTQFFEEMLVMLLNIVFRRVNFAKIQMILLIKHQRKKELGRQRS